MARPKTEPCGYSLMFIGRFSDAGDKVTVQEAKEALDRAREAVEQDLDLLKEHIDKIVQAFEESEKAQAEYRSRVHGNGRSD